MHSQRKRSHAQLNVNTDIKLTQWNIYTGRVDGKLGFRQSIFCHVKITLHNRNNKTCILTDHMIRLNMFYWN